ncbi:MAG: hypothetical protein K0V04_02500 [Deltaproteobacteria bacterium]|nr:hypothetical protein [Deltaproteobacteria bacterium]
MRVSGNVLRAREQFIRSRSPQAWGEVLAEVSEPTREAVASGLLETRWYPYEVLIDLSSTADRVLGKGDWALCREMGRFSCEKNLTTVHRLLLKFGNVGHLVERAATAWRSQFDAGEIIIHERHRDLYVVEVRGVPEPSRAHCAGISGWMARAAELSGEDDFQLEEKCRALDDGYCMWTFTRQAMEHPGR